MAKCKYERGFPPDTEFPLPYECSEEALPESKEGYCIFHERSKDKDLEKFNAGIKARMEKKDYEFTGYYFPVEIDFSKYNEGKFEGHAFFEEAEFQDEASFDGAEFQGEASFQEAKFQGKAWFGGAKFQGKAWFFGAKFQGWAVFEGARFQGWAWFRGAEFQRAASFDGAEFQGEASFQGAKFQGKAWFGGAKFQGRASFEGAEFQGDASFRRAEFQDEASFEEAEFQGEASFEEAEFHGNASFLQTEFKGWVRFDGVKLHSEAWLKGAKFQGSAWFDGAKFQGEANFEAAKFLSFASFERAEFARTASFRRADFNFATDAEVAYRKAKISYQREGDYAKAGYYYLKEMRARRAQRNPIIRSLEFLSIDLTCGYGEQWWRVIPAALVVIGIFSLLYLFSGAIVFSGGSEVMRLRGPLDALYFSVVTFTTLGYGDWHPDPNHWIRYVAMTEAFTGAFMMALFILCFARKWMR